MLDEEYLYVCSQYNPLKKKENSNDFHPSYHYITTISSIEVHPKLDLQEPCNLYFQFHFLFIYFLEKKRDFVPPLLVKYEKVDQEIRIECMSYLDMMVVVMMTCIEVDKDLSTDQVTKMTLLYLFRLEPQESRYTSSIEACNGYWWW